MGSAKGYSLWAMPSGAVFDKLAEVIAGLSQKFSTPTFEPHVTVISGVEEPEEAVLSVTSKLASELRPYEIELTIPCVLDDYFKCLYLKVVPAEAVVEAHRKASALFKRQPEHDYIPHLSLLYGILGPEEKERIAASIGGRLSLTFEVNSIHLFSTQGAPRDWRRVVVFDLYRAT